MRRRSFLATCSAFVAGCALGVGVTVNKLAETTASVKKNALWILNPEYFKAQYEIRFFYAENVRRLVPIETQSARPHSLELDGHREVREAYPVRYNVVNGERVIVPPTIMQDEYARRTNSKS